MTAFAPRIVSFSSKGSSQAPDLGVPSLKPVKGNGRRRLESINPPTHIHMPVQMALREPKGNPQRLPSERPNIVNKWAITGVDKARDDSAAHANAATTPVIAGPTAAYEWPSIGSPHDQPSLPVLHPTCWISIPTQHATPQPKAGSRLKG